MRHPIRRILGSATAITLMFFVAACGGKETVASKSAAAFREAQRKGTAVGGGHAGHDNGAADSTAAAGTSSVDHSTMAGMDHSTMTGMDHSNAGDAAPTGMTGMDHSKMNVSGASTMSGMDHSNMPGMQRGTRSASSMAGMDHSRTAGTGAQMSTMDHSNMSGMDHSSMPGMPADAQPRGQQPMAAMDHSNMPGMKPGAPPQGQQPTAGMDHSTMPGMQHGATGAANVVTAAPSSNAEMQRVQPSSTLRPDAFDAPVAASVAEATKATQDGGGHGGHQTGGTSPPAVDHSQHSSAAQSLTPQTGPAATIYTCPMHPEVTSDKPGTCPKCGMTLVPKK